MWNKNSPRPEDTSNGALKPRPVWYFRSWQAGNRALQTSLTYVRNPFGSWVNNFYSDEKPTISRMMTIKAWFWIIWNRKYRQGVVWNSVQTSKFWQHFLAVFPSRTFPSLRINQLSLLRVGQGQVGGIRRSSASPRPPCDGTHSATVLPPPRRTPGPQTPVCAYRRAIFHWLYL